jgi:DNA-binding NarL/FixJ family response regulator
MSIFRRNKRSQVGSRRNNKNSYALDVTLPQLQTKSQVIKGNQQYETNSVSANGLPNILSSDDFRIFWKSLPPRQQDVTALTCLRYTNPQIAARLRISELTVRSYLQKVFIRLKIETKADLRVLLANIDFSAWV